MSLSSNPSVVAGELVVTLASIAFNSYVTKGAYDQMMDGGKKSTTNRFFFLGTAVLNLTFVTNLAFSIAAYTADTQNQDVKNSLFMLFTVGVVFSYISIAITIFSQVRRLRVVETVMPLPFKAFKEFLYCVMAVAMSISSIGYLTVNSIKTYNPTYAYSKGAATFVATLWPVIMFIIQLYISVTVVRAIRHHQQKNLTLLNSKSSSPIELLKSQDKAIAYKWLMISMFCTLSFDVVSIGFAAVSIIQASNLLYRLGMLFYSFEIRAELFYMQNVKILMVGREHKNLTPDTSTISGSHSQTQSMAQQSTLMNGEGSVGKSASFNNSETAITNGDATSSSIDSSIV